MGAMWRRRLGYGVGDFALNLFWQGSGYYLLFYFTDVVGLPGTLAGAILAIGGLWDAVSDPLMGYVAERTHSRRGLYRPFLLWGAAPLALSFALLFTPLDWGTTAANAAWALMVLIIFQTCYTVVAIPYSAISARITTDGEERTRLAGVRMYCGFIGGLIAVFMAGQWQRLLGDAWGFPAFGVFCGLLSIPFLLICYRSTGHVSAAAAGGQPAGHWRDLLGSMRHNKAFLLLCGGIAGVTIAGTVIGRTLLYYFEYGLGDRASGNHTIMAMTFIALVAIPSWSFLALKLGKRAAWLSGCGLTLVSVTALYLNPSGQPLVAMVLYVAIALGLGAFAVLFWSVLPDTIDYGEHRSGVRNESVLVGFVSSAQKFSFAIAAFTLGVLLDAIGYQAGMAQTPETLEGLRLIILIVPVLGIGAAALAFAFYPITAQSQRQVAAALAARHAVGDADLA
ncbi:MAG: MFS transporter [Sphingomonadales bacterium]